MNETLYINLFGGPGTGKSTLCAFLFAELKCIDINAEMALEYVKDLVYEESTKKIENQIYIFGKQHSRLNRLNGKVDVVITDSPLLNSIVYYGGDNPHFKELVLFESNKVQSLNFYIARSFKYRQEGRFQNEDGAKKVDDIYKKLLDDSSVPYLTIDPGIEAVPYILKCIKQRLGVDDVYKEEGIDFKAWLSNQTDMMFSSREEMFERYKSSTL